MDSKTLAAIEASDTDALLRIIDGWCEARMWEAMVEVRLHFSAALERGKQLWGVDEHVRYRLALEGPAELAAAMINEGPTRFTLGPLTEVAAQRLTWEETQPHLDPGPARSMFAHERVIRGERISGDVDPSVLEIPFEISDWEPRYQTAEYKTDRVEFPAPPSPKFSTTRIDTRPIVFSDPEVEEPLRLLTAPWVEESTGRGETRAVEGGALDAIAALGAREFGVAKVNPSEALEWMAWAAACGGALGRRRGAAAGRFGAWWAAAALTGFDWPVDPQDLGTTLDELNWLLWSDGDETGWHLRLAVEDPEHGVAWATSAVDSLPAQDPSAKGS